MLGMIKRTIKARVLLAGVLLEILEPLTIKIFEGKQGKYFTHYKLHALGS